MMKELLCSKNYSNPRDRDWSEELPSESQKSRLGFLHDVQWFSEYWQIDTDIYQVDRELEVHFYFRWNRFAGTFKSDLARMIWQSASVKIPLRKSRPCKSELILIWKNDRED